MNRTIRILSLISVVLSWIGTLIAIVTLTFLWEPINIMLDMPESVVEATSVIPIGSIISIFGCMIISVCLFLSYKTRRFIIEILAIVFLSIVLPVLTYYINMAQSIFVTHYISDNAFTILGIANEDLIFAMVFINLSKCLCLITSGMRIAKKNHLSNKDNLVN